MKEIIGDVWDYYKKEKTIICIPTNGSVKYNGYAVMGRGVAAQAKIIIPGIDKDLGYLIRLFGNHPNWLDNNNCLSFPVKEYWQCSADLNLIQNSRDKLIEIANCLDEHKFYLPRPGCGNGGLDYKNVHPLMLSLPDNVYIINLS